MIQQICANADSTERGFVDRLLSHPVLCQMDSLPEGLFLEVLLQRRFISLIFPVVYDVGIDALGDDAAIRLVRQIVREEYPDASGRTPSHREELVHDLVSLGASKGASINNLAGCG